MASASETEAPAPGTIVGLDLGGSVARAEVLEDRGDDGEVRVFEVPAEELPPPPESPSS